MSNQTGAVLTIIGGVFYIAGSFVGGFVTSIIGAFASPGRAVAAGVAIAAFGIFTGVLIIVGGALLNSDSSGRRKAGGILAIVMMVLGAIPTLAGFVIGFFFILVGAVIGLTYKRQPDFMIGTAPMFPYQSRAPSPQSIFTPATKGQVKFCIKCGSPLHAGAAFCASCGAEVPQS